MKLGQVLGLTLCAVAAYLGGSASASAATGKTAGTFSVSPTGAATYTIPIWAAPGPHGLQPKLSLIYNSQLTGAGIMGPGWSLSGLSTITRCNRTLAQDGVPAAVSLTYKDAFCLDGNRLRLTSSETLSSYGQDGTTYQTEVANFTNVTAHGSAGAGPAWFSVQHPDGTTYEYGATGNSQVVATGGTTAVSWMLDKITDRAGNTLTIAYTAASATLTGTTVPATISWTPSSAGSSSYNYTMTFVYTNNVPASSLTGYVAGTTVVNQDLLLNIAITNSSGATIKDYFLGYDTSPTTGAYRLTQVKECADSSASNCLLPTSISYQNGSTGFGSVQTLVSSQSAAPNKTYSAYDFNGDGRTDLAWYVIGSHWMVSFATAGGYAAPVDTGITASYVMPGNLRGTSTDGLLAYSSGGVLVYYEWNGSSFFATFTGITLTGQWALADVNGDGRPDLVYIGSDNYIYLSLNTSTSGGISFGPAVKTIANDNIVIGSNYRSSRHLQFFGRGQDDLYGGNSSGMTILHYNGTTFVETLFGQGVMDFADFNDDGCTDMLTNSGIYMSGCNGTPGGFVSTGSLNPIALIDWDGNGRKDVLTPGNGVNCAVYLSNGNGLNSNWKSTNLPSNLNSGAQFSTIPNAAGDGLDGLAIFQATAPYAIQYYLHSGTAQLPDVAVSFTDGYGINFSPTYQSITLGSYTEGNTATYPEMDIATPLYVVSQVTQSDGIGGTYSQTHTYSGARQNLQGYGFEGFAQHKIADNRANSLVQQVDYNQGFPLTGTIGDEATYQHDGVTPVSKALYELSDTVLDSTANNQRHFPTLKLKEQFTYDVGGALNGTATSEVTTTYTWDNYGNATNVSVSTTDQDPNSPYAYQSWTTTTVTTVTADTSSNWCLNIPTQVQVYKYSPSSGSSILRTTSYDSPADTIHCRINHENIEPGNPTYAVTHAYLYDSFGNISDDMVTGVGMATRITSTNWGMTGQFPVSVENPLLQTTQYGYDPSFGVRTSVTDPNGLTTSWSIDNFGRRTRETRTDGTATTWTYNDCASSTCLFGNHALVVAQAVLNADQSTQTDGTTYFDQLDRPVVTTKRLLASGSYDRNETHYDNFGRVVQQGVPCVWSGVTTPCPYMVSNAYNAVGRVTQTSRPSSATNSSPNPVNIAYSGRTTVLTDVNGKQSVRVNDVVGDLVRSTDANGYYQNFVYDGWGSLLSVTDSNSNTLFVATYDYGIGAFQRNATDMDLDVSTAAGQHRQYTYDALGELTSWTDAKGQSFSETYDALSRPLSRTESDLTTTWTWGSAAASYNIGKLQSVAANSAAGNYSESYSYDNDGRLAVRAITIPADGTYTYSYAYNTTSGLLDSLTYPFSTGSYQLKLHYAYQNGTLQSVSDANAGTVFWNATATNARNQVTSEALGNGVVTTRTLDAVTGLPTQVLSGVGGGYGLQNDSYLFDALGNLTQRQNNNAGLTENFYYDSLYRLDHSQLGGAVNLQMHYDATGNITSRSDVGSGAGWTYDANRKHAVTSAGPYTYTYDNNGNATTRGNETITWTSYNHPLQISGGGESIQFAYDHNHTRWKSVYSGSSGLETTYFIGNLLEKVITAGPSSEFRHYIYAGGIKVAIYSRSPSGITLRYLREDHEGSFAAILGSDGTTYAKESFTPYGSRRNTCTWSGPPTNGALATTEKVSRRGYTDATALGRMGLNDMKGRIQDAVTGRFLSADPVLTRPSNTQSFNRYSYVLNNPLTYIDPRGFDPVCVSIYSPGEGEVISLPDGTFEVIVPSTGTSTTICTSIPTIPNYFPTPGGGSSGGSPGSQRYVPPKKSYNPLLCDKAGIGCDDHIDQQKVASQLCHAGNSMQSASEKLAQASLRLEGVGGTVLVASALTGNALGVEVGGALAGTGGAGSIFASGLQASGGVLQVIATNGRAGWSNVGYGLLAGGGGVGLGLAGSALKTPGASVAQRAVNSQLDNGAAVAGLANDAVGSAVSDASPSEVECPETQGADGSESE